MRRRICVKHDTAPLTLGKTSGVIMRSSWRKFVPMHGTVFALRYVLKRLNTPLNIMFLKNKLHCNNHRTMYSITLK